MVTAAAFAGTGRHCAPYPLFRRLTQAGTITALATIPLAAVYGSAHARTLAPAAPTAPVVSAAAAMRVEHNLNGRISVTAAQLTYRVRAGDTLSRVASRQLGATRLWPELWWLNRHRVANPDALNSGTTLKLAPLPPLREKYTDAAIAAIPPPPPPPPAPGAQAPAGAAANPPPVAQAAPAGSNVSTSGMGSFQACVISRESGGNPQALNPSGAGGLYQFLPSTWALLGYSGLPQNAPVWEQNQAFQKAYARWGTQPWAPSDGC